jgi:hypothetical protein
MATITLTEVLGTDNVALSRTILNQNFSTVSNAINTLELYLNTTPAGAALSVGSVLINQGANSVNDPLFTNEGSGVFLGNLSVQQDLNLPTGNLTVGGGVTFSNGLILTGTGPNPVFTIGTLATPVDVYHVAGMKIDQQFGNTIATPAHQETQLGSGIFEIDVEDKYIIYLDYINYNIANPDAANITRLTGTAEIGQKLFIQISGAPAGGGTFEIDNAGFLPQYTANIPFSGANPDELKKLWIEVIYLAGGWKVIGSHPSMTNI